MSNCWRDHFLSKLLLCFSLYRDTSGPSALCKGLYRVFPTVRTPTLSYSVSLLRSMHSFRTANQEWRSSHGDMEQNLLCTPVSLSRDKTWDLGLISTMSCLTELTGRTSQSAGQMRNTKKANKSFGWFREIRWDGKWNRALLLKTSSSMKQSKHSHRVQQMSSILDHMLLDQHCLVAFSDLSLTGRYWHICNPRVMCLEPLESGGSTPSHWSGPFRSTSK